MFRPARHVVACQANRAGIHQERTGNSIEERGLPRAVGPNDDDEGPFSDRQIYTLQGTDFVRGTGVKRL